MKTCVIFCAARFDRLAEPVKEEDFIIAADGGLRHTRALGLHPQMILGDFDSLGYVPQDGHVFPVEKDDTDAMLAVRCGLAEGCDRFLVYGSVDGPRLDHTVANFQLLQFLADNGAEGYLIGEDYLITVLKEGAMWFPAGGSGLISIFCMGADAEGVTIRGLKYPLTDGVMTAGFPLGVSNEFTGSAASISVRKGSLLVMFPRHVGFPHRQEAVC